MRLNARRKLTAGLQISSAGLFEGMGKLQDALLAEGGPVDL